MIAQLFSKPQLQQVLKDLRKAGYIVNKEPGRYLVYIDDRPMGKPVLVAMNGQRGYLVRYEEQLLTPAA